MSLARTVLAALAWIFVGLVALQVFLAGVGLFGAGDLELHRDLGYAVAAFPLLLLLATWPARPGRQLAWLSAALLVIGHIQTALPSFREDLPFIAALHPVNALAIFWLGLVVARRATAAARSAGAPDTAVAEARTA